MTAYLTIPICLPGDPAQNNPDKEVPGKILPSTVLAYHEGYYGGTFLYLQTGQAFLTSLTVKEYEDRVNAYWMEIGKKVGQSKIHTFNGRH